MGRAFAGGQALLGQLGWLFARWLFLEIWRFEELKKYVLGI